MSLTVAFMLTHSSETNCDNSNEDRKEYRKDIREALIAMNVICYHTYVHIYHMICYRYEMSIPYIHTYIFTKWMHWDGGTYRFAETIDPIYEIRSIWL